jgi:hypothetical protein
MGALSLHLLGLRFPVLKNFYQVYLKKHRIFRFIKAIIAFVYHVARGEWWAFIDDDWRHRLLYGENFDYRLLAWTRLLSYHR